MPAVHPAHPVLEVSYILLSFDRHLAHPVLEVMTVGHRLAMKITAVWQILLLPIIVGCAHVATCNTFYGNETDRLSLLEFKNAISLDPHQSMISWNESTYFCNWEGILCRVKTPHRVTSLNLTNRGLVGKISPWLGNLTFLTHLSLSANSFTAEIPPSLGYLHRLQTLYLSNNTLQERIPSLANCSNLKVMWLYGNNLDGKIPIDLPPNLQVINLSNNNLTGTIPSSLFNISTLTSVGFMFNHIDGEIPNEIGKLPKLRAFFSAVNKLSGRFQPAILNLSSLVTLSLGSNYLSGELPSNLGSSLPNLQNFGLFDNLFHGHIPSSVFNASKLVVLDISGNNFTGAVPSSIGKLKELSLLNLQDNQLQARDMQDWEFMNSLTNCTELQKISLQENHLQGQIPKSSGNFSANLEMLLFGSNRLSGFFPNIANLHNLIVLGLEENQFKGVIPEWLGTLRKLQGIALSNNIFTGYIASSFSNLSQLGQLYLDSNQLHGHVPPSLGNLTVLETLEISSNNLNGGIPKEIFSIPTLIHIGLSSNSINGPLSTEVGNSKQLVLLMLSSNNLSSDIPDTLANCDSMEVIELDHNFFSGRIPASLGNIRSLELLNVSHNQLSDSIPKSIGRLQYLLQLDLSFNNLEGEVPTEGIFKNETGLWIAGNKGLCGGASKLRLPACPIIISRSNKHMPSIVLKVVIPLVIIVSLAMVISVLLFWKRREKKTYLSLSSFGTNFPRVSYHDLDRATDGFSAPNLIGRGGYGAVYKGKLLQEGTVVAVKVFSLEARGAEKSFITECNTLRNVRHRNLVSIITACSSIDSEGNDFKAIVYEFMPKGDLDALLYSTRGDQNTSNLECITLAQRLGIMVDVADALAHLHHNHHETVVHCDLKPSNILLDDNMTAHVGDFGLARFKVNSVVSSSGDPYSTSSIAINGTIGYVSPECATDGHVSTASDVYSFGIVLFEIFLRKRPTDDMFKDGLNIAKFVEMNFPAKISQIVEPELLQDQPEFPEEPPVAMKEDNLDCLISVLDIGLRCTKQSPGERPNMQEVAAGLHAIKEAYLRGY